MFAYASLCRFPPRAEETTRGSPCPTLPSSLQPSNQIAPPDLESARKQAGVEKTWSCTQECLGKCMVVGPTGAASRFVGSVLVELVRAHFWGPINSGYLTLLKRAWIDWKAYRKRNNLVAKIPKFTRGRLGWPDLRHYPEYKGKAYDCRSLVSWVASSESIDLDSQFATPSFRRPPLQPQLRFQIQL